jgi:hypothetical protein
MVITSLRCMVSIMVFVIPFRPLIGVLGRNLDRSPEEVCGVPFLANGPKSDPRTDENTASASCPNMDIIVKQAEGLSSEVTSPQA